MFDLESSRDEIFIPIGLGIQSIGGTIQLSTNPKGEI